MYPAQAHSKYRPAQVTQLSEAISYLDELLEIGDFQDYGPNGLQVTGSRELSVVVTGVSAHRELFERAAEAGADLVIAHHGLFWDFHPRSLSPTMSATAATVTEITCVAGLPASSVTIGPVLPLPVA
jgi:hypothetical protein